MSSRQIIHIETDFLAKILNFQVNFKTLLIKNIIATTEDLVKDLQKEEADTICVKVIPTSQTS